MPPAGRFVAIAALLTCSLGAFAQTKGERWLVESIPCASVNDVEAFERESGALTQLSPPIRSGGELFREVYSYGNNRLFFYSSEPVGINHRRIVLHIPSQAREVTFLADMALVSLPDHWISHHSKAGISVIVIYFLNTVTRRMNRFEFEVYFDQNPGGGAPWLEGKLLRAAEMDGVCDK